METDHATHEETRVRRVLWPAATQTRFQPPALIARLNRRFGARLAGGAEIEQDALGAGRIL
jgi:hypothetical protein